MRKSSFSLWLTKNGRLLDVILVVFLLIVVIFSVARATFDERWSPWAYGDAQNLNAARHFVEEGFVKHYYLTYYTPGYLGTQRASESEVGYYTHTPPLSAIILGIEWKLFGENLFAFRVFSIIISALTLIFLYILGMRLFNRPVALISTIFVGLTPAFLGYTDSLSPQPYDEFFRFGILVTFVFSESFRHNRHGKLFLILTWVLFLLESLNSVEYIVFLILFFAGYWLLVVRIKPFPYGRLAFFVLAPIIALTVHLAQDAAALGGFANAYRDWFSIFGTRTVAISGLISGLNLRLHTEFGFGMILFAIAFIVPGLFDRFLPKYGKFDGLAKKIPALSILALLTLCSLSFWFIFTEASQSMAIYTVRHFFPSIGFAVGLMVVYLINFAGGTKLSLLKVPAVCVVIIMLIEPTLNTARYIEQFPNFLNRDRVQGMPAISNTSMADAIAISKELRNKTSFGDVIIHNLGTLGTTEYPFNVFEYYSARRNEIHENDPERLQLQVIDLEDYSRRVEAQYGHHIEIYALVDANANHNISNRLYQYLLPLCSSEVLDDRWTLFNMDNIRGQNMNASGVVMPAPDKDWTKVMTNLDINTSGTDMMPKVYHDSGIDNKIGITVEAKLKIDKAPENGELGMMLAIQDGVKEGKLSFYADHVTVFDHSYLSLSSPINTGDYHTYRLILLENRFIVEVDGAKIADITLKSDFQVDKAGILIGDFSDKTGENVQASITYLAYLNNGAYWSDGTQVTILKTIVPKIGVGQNWTKVMTNLDINTSGTDMMPKVYHDSGIDNKIGITVEAKLKIDKAPENGELGMMLAIQDGVKEGKLSFYADHVTVFDHSYLSLSSPINTGDYHTYRLILLENRFIVEVDGAKIADITLKSDFQVDKAGILIGDFSDKTGENVQASITYLAYLNNGAYWSDGTQVTILKTIVPKIGVGQNWTKVMTNLDINTSGTDMMPKVYHDSGIDNKIGITVEAKLKIDKAPENGELGMMLAIQDGVKEGKLSFYADHVTVFDHSYLSLSSPINTGDYHTYRLILLENRFIVEVDGAKIADITLKSDFQVDKAGILIGDFSDKTGENVQASITYLAYLNNGAYRSDGTRIIMP